MEIQNKQELPVNYKNKQRYNTGKKPIRQPIYLTWLIGALSFFALLFQKKKIEKINMEGLKPPYMILSNHMSFVDFELTALGTFPQRVNSVVNVDGYIGRAWLMEWIGSVCTRKFSTDLSLVKNISTVLRRGDVLCLYPEARYSPCGTTSYLPPSLGKIIKKNKVPIVAVVHRGNHLLSPFWNFRKKRKVPLHTTMTQILTKEDIERMSVDEINAVVQASLQYDDYRYQKENGILIKEKYRAEGLHRILYQCPHCKTESKMDSKGTELFCTECGKRWNMNEDGTLSALEGETEFSHIPDWFEWEREQVRKQVESGEYSFADEVDVFSQPRTNGFVSLGKAKLTHDRENGFIVEGHHNGSDYRLIRKPLESNSLHVEYEYFRIRRADCFDISMEKDSYYCYPTKENVITKLAFATEEIFLRAMREREK